jgi:cell division protein FtsQ
MSKKKRQMATVKRHDSSTKPTKWFWRLVIVVFMTGAMAGVIQFRQTIALWFEPLFANDKTTVTHVEEKSQEQQRESEGWQVALVTPTEFVSAEELENYVKAKLKDSFFSLDVQQASEILATHPWVKNVNARKVWPNTLLVDVEEHQPWLNLNNQQLISREGVVFEPKNAADFKELPLLVGHYGDVDDLLSMYHFFTEQMPSDEFRITKLSFHVYNGWTMWLENGITLFLGKQQLTERLERFLSVLHEMKNNQRDQISYIDLRYPSGVAVGWKEKGSKEQIAGN